MTSATEALEAEIRELLIMILKLPQPHAIDVVRGSVPQWDSLKHMELVFALEDRFGVQFGEDEFPQLDSPRAITAKILSHRAA
jgi:acyl carrier protein